MRRYHLRKSEALALILSHRRDADAISFFKNTMPKAAKTAKKVGTTPRPPPAAHNVDRLACFTQMKKANDGVGEEDQQKIDAPNRSARPSQAMEAR